MKLPNHNSPEDPLPPGAGSAFKSAYVRDQDHFDWIVEPEIWDRWKETVMTVIRPELENLSPSDPRRKCNPNAADAAYLQCLASLEEDHPEHVARWKTEMILNGPTEAHLRELTESKFRTTIGLTEIKLDDPIIEGYSGRGVSHWHDYRPTRWQRFKRWVASTFRRKPKRQLWDGGSMFGGPINRTPYWKPVDSEENEFASYGEKENGDVMRYAKAWLTPSHTIYYVPEKEYEVWSEGYAVTGNRADATFHGKFRGATFKDACQAWADTLSDESRWSYYNGHKHDIYDAEANTYWGCQLFDNEADARRSFG